MRSVVLQHLNKLLCLTLCTVLLGTLCCGVLAIPEARCQLLIDYRYEDVAISNAAFHIYRLADLDSNGELVYCEDFSSLDFDKEELPGASEALFAYVESRGISPDQILVTDSYGNAAVSDMMPGVFLLVSEPAAIDYYVYYSEKQVIFLQDDTLTLRPKTTRLPEGTRLISIKAVKFWDDSGNENKRPQQITVRLLKDGKTFSSVVLSNSNNWSHTWNDLLPNARWTVEEDVPKGYVVSVQASDRVFTLTNHYKDIPQTGQVWWPVLTVLGVGIFLIVIGIVIRRSNRNEI